MRRQRSVAERFWAHVLVTDDCWQWTGSVIATSGYGYASGIRRNGRNQPLLAHRLSWELTNGSIPEGMWVLHSCDNPICVRPEHLFLGTAKDNVADMCAKGRQRGQFPRGRPGLRGEASPSAKLSESDIHEIRSAALAGTTQTTLASQFGVSQSLISLIIRGDRWRHVRARSLP